jgi:hypothetical protein
MATLAVQAISAAGTEVSYDPAGASGDKTVPGDRTFLHVVNGAGAPVTVTIVTPGTVSGLAIADRQVVVTNGESRMIALAPSLYRNRADSGLAAWTYSSNASVTVAALSI